MDIVASYTANGYAYASNLIDTGSCKFLTDELNTLIASGLSNKDEQCPMSDAVYGAPVFDNLLEQMTPVFEKLTGKSLLPTYSYARRYKCGEELKIHTDRPACEISATITLGFDGEVWPIYMADSEDKENSAIPILINIGDGVIYNGCEKHHWRKPFSGKWQTQVFLHYVDANGANTEFKYDKRPCLSHKKESAEDILYWYYVNAIEEHTRLNIIKKRKDYSLEEAKVGPISIEKVNKNIRDVKMLSLSPYLGVGALAVGAGLDANSRVWNFDITHANQCDLLEYTKDGKYLSHIDTFVGLKNEECRKLTILMFLNDDFEGGKFYLQFSHTKVYPPQTPGTILVFPSFILHGVEPVVSGTRYTVVTWLLGPRFR